MSEYIMAGLLLAGSAVMLIGGVGILRMPDLFSRMQATTKSMTLGVAFLLLAAVIHFNEVGVGIRAVLVIFFYFLTSPVAAHMIGRAAYFIGVPLWKGTEIDELKGRYDRESHELASSPREPVSGRSSLESTLRHPEDTPAPQ
ncbi:MAG: monovalent cation/H(+) antiporter subunit G [Phycisphaerae bacterium]|nr:monovalent cation/H(+) antiporter subunit G [Phycisphaerae bacterium]